ncbi:C45 family autoproteolytic acyltransferase/hydolase [Lentibacillus saliphilus]|uniref:C45 family autoproteolytic acyltransferase/hydolase n=1 Tax=Lentibacillus saliphilus TaxID=2737028 RepID=UPI001C3015C2|nr:C45 family peptidase [Lentibacillus saliphilus]
MTSTLMATVEQYRGSMYQIGQLQARQLTTDLFNKLSAFKSSNFNVDNAIDVYTEFAPHRLEEIRGLSDEICIPFHETAALFLGYGIPDIPGMGCSSIVTSTYAVRNYDFSPDLYDGRFMLIQPRECYASVGTSLHITGRHEGVNERGLFTALHFVNQNEISDGLTATAIVRILLDTCKDIPEAIHVLKQLPHAWSYNFSLADEDGRQSVVEVTPDAVRVRDGQTRIMCTNHFQHQDMISQNRHIDYTNSYQRIEEMSEQIYDQMDGDAAFSKFKDPDSPLFYKDYAHFFGTLHTFAYMYKTDLIMIALPNGKTLKFSWTDWLSGSDLAENQLIGHLDQQPNKPT